LGAVDVPTISDDDKEKEYLLLYAIFQKHLQEFEDDEWSLIEELSAQRVDSLVKHALKGYGITEEQARKAIDEYEEGNSQREEVRNILKAAIDNMCEFGAAEEYQCVKNLPYGIGETEDLDEDELEELMAAFEKYNSRYANTENLDVEYAMGMAAMWVLIAAGTELMYMTQGDERVRPWHLQWEGYSAPKVMFPEWLIPPIEHQCRCYLVEVGPNAHADILKDVRAKVVKEPTRPDWFNGTFKESVCKGGRIFSDEHPYFTIDAADTDRLGEIVESLKRKYYGG